ncbi:aminoglycoside 6-adenylyltransferase [Halobacillus litoralis]|uniref:aminoglycoside 6-adenylyltransferase n=1 Tax=Halobacillus litoralis TaxID=45668 RepID=UPI001CD794FF|nr:aminoglycoside 6-adenylyltransferase [Halobacillus litoralis]MCA0968995.1 aminoglycoside 6-adenylyltransferase [Halobacillus litoralis]
MRDENEMLERILTTAKNDDRIRAVWLNGSRANPQAKRDRFQDFDIVYIVHEFESFTKDHSWVDTFGERLIMQLPDENEDGRTDSFAYLMQFTDGNRIDLTLHIPNEHPSIDSLTVVLLDKDGVWGNVPAPSEKDYWVRKPSAKEFAACSNEFWWVSTYVAKGLCRKEMPYARETYEGPVRHMLKRMLSWYVGAEHEFEVNVGSFGKYLESYLPADLWAKYERTYRNGTYEETWDGLLGMCDLFSLIGEEVARKLGYGSPVESKVWDYLLEMRYSAKYKNV